MKKTTTTIAVFLNTWRNYNVNGADGGFWINLPCDLDSELERLAKSTGEEVDEMEVFINDYETSIDGLEISEYSNISELNEIAKELEQLDEYELEKLSAILEAYDENLSEALENIDDYIYYSEMTLEEVAREHIENGCFGNIPEEIVDYIDYEAIARDLNFNGYTETSNGVIYR